MINDDSVRLLVTMPADVRKWLQERAKYNGGSVSAELVRTACERVDETETPRPSGVAS